MIKKLAFLCGILLVINSVSAQNNDTKIIGPTCIKLDDTVTYRVNHPKAGYHWIVPPDFIELNWIGDSVIICKVASAVSQPDMAYSASKFTLKDATVLDVHFMIEPPYLVVLQKGFLPGKELQIDTSSNSIVFNQIQSMFQREIIDYEWSADNPLWTFEESKKAKVTYKSFLAKRMQVNIPGGKGQVMVKATGVCNSTTAVLKLSKLMVQKQ